MLRCYSTAFLVLSLSLSIGASQECAASSGIKMLPPEQSGEAGIDCRTTEGNKILTWDGSNSLRCNKGLTVSQEGKLGVGTTDPKQLLTVNKQDGNWGGPAGSGTSQPNAAFRLQQGSLSSDFGMHGTGTFWIQNALTSNLGAPYPLALNPIGGNVGIGTLAPASKLDIVGSGHISRDSIAECCSGGNMTLSLAENTQLTGRLAGIQFHNGGWAEAYFRLARDGQRRFLIGDNQGVTTGLQMSGPLYVDNVGVSYISGNVGIGTTSPNAKLDVAGTVRSVTKSNYYVVDFNYLTAKHDWCNTSAFAQGTNASYGFKAACVSACSRFCQQDHGYSGGVIVEWSGATAGCLCSP